MTPGPTVSLDIKETFHHTEYVNKGEIKKCLCVSSCVVANLNIIGKPDKNGKAKYMTMVSINVIGVV